MSESDDQLIAQLEKAIDDSVAATKESMEARAKVAKDYLDKIAEGTYGASDAMKYAVNMWLVSLGDVGRLAKILSDFRVSGDS